MALFYLGGAGMVIGLHAGELPRTLLAIVRDAFSFRAVSGGAVGAGISLLPPALRYGISRGVFSMKQGLEQAESVCGGTDRRSRAAGVHQHDRCVR